MGIGRHALTRDPQMGLVLRTAKMADLPGVEACVDAAYRPYIAEIGVAPGPMSDDYRALIAGGHVHVIVDEAAAIVGVFVMFVRDDHILLDNAAIHPQWQNRGLAMRFLDIAMRTARQRAIATLRLYTHAKMSRNRALYRRMGFVETERRTEKGFDRVYMEMKLAALDERLP
jgi:ribosomal protein S18 acetylase RimI-like enzyme